MLTTPGHIGKTYELTGDEAHTLGDLAAEISRQTGKDIPYKDLSESDNAAARVKLGLPEAAAKAYAGSDTGASQGALWGDGRQLSKLIGRPATPLRVSVAEALNKGA